MDDIAKVLAEASLLSSQEAAQALRAGGVLATVRENDVRGLAEIYQMRLDHLKSLQGSHAETLAAEVAELLENLRGAVTVQTTNIEGPGELAFGIFLTDSGTKLIGCVGGVDKREVSEAQWERLWQGAV